MIKKTIEELDNTKQSQLNALRQSMSNIKEQLCADIHSCQMRSTYQKEIAKQVDKPIFTLHRIKFHESMHTNLNSPMHRGKGRKRKHDEDLRCHQHTACQSFVLANNDSPHPYNDIEDDAGQDTIQLKYDYLSKHIRK